MKRVLSLILALVMILGTLPMAFAADQTAGEMLKASGFVAGDENGNLNEGNEITRAELAVLVAELNGVKENAKTYAIAPEFKDVKADEWFAPYVAYAAKEGWFKGDDAGNFNPTAKVSSQVMATVMLRALGYEPAWETAVSEAKAMGLPVGAADAAMMTRGEAFSTMWGVVNTPKMGSDVALGVELGKIEPATPAMKDLVATIDDTKAIATNLVEVEFTAAVDAAAAGNVDGYSIVEKDDTTKEVSIVAVTVESDTIVVLETETLTAGKGYTVVVADSKDNFAGIKKETSAPKVDSVKGTDDGIVEVTFEDALVGKVSAEDVANYSIDKEGTVVKAVLNGDRDKVTLTVEGLTSPSSKKLTIENIASTDGVVLKKVIKPFGPKFDTIAPKLDKVYPSKKNNVEVIVDFTDTHGVDKATAEDVANYSIDGLEIISAKAVYQDGDNDDYYKRVVLTTSDQTKSKKYVLKVLYMMDGSAAKNATTKVLDEDFRGGTQDKDEPKIATTSDVSIKNLTTIHVKFTEKNGLDLSTALDAGNYTFKDGDIEVVGVELDDADENGNSYDIDITGKATGTNNDKIDQTGDDLDDITVVLTVTSMEEAKYYRLRVNNIADNFGNTMDKQIEKSVRIAKDGEKTSYSIIEKAETSDLEKVVVYFSEDVIKASANDPTNYMIDNGVGAVKKASRSSSNNKKVTLTVEKLVENKTYEITVNGVENYWGYATEDVTKKFVAIKDGVDSEQPEVEGVEYTNTGELRITFSEAMKLNGTANVKFSTDGTLSLVAKELLEDDMVVVFNASFATDGLIPADAAHFNAVYKIVDFTGVQDKAGNAVDYSDNAEEFTTEGAVLANDDRVSNNSLGQENGNVIHATFDREVMDIVKGTNDIVTARIIKKDGTVSTDTMTFTAQRDDDDHALIILTAKSPTKFDDKTWELEFNFGAPGDAADGTYTGTAPIAYGSELVVRDVLGRRVEDKAVTTDVDNDDDLGPAVVEVKVIDNVTIEVEYDEKLSTTGSFYLKNLDDDKETFIVTEKLKDADTTGNVIKLTLNKKMTSEDSYELGYNSSKPKDLEGNKVDNDSESFEFVGSDLDPSKDAVVTKVFSALSATVVSTGDDFPVNPTITADNSVAVGTPTVTGTGDERDVLMAKYYALLSKNAAGKVVTYTVAVSDSTFTGDHTFQTFTGVIEEDSASAVSSTTDAQTVVTAIDMTFDSGYEYSIIIADGTVIASSVGANAITGNTAGQFVVPHAAFAATTANVKLVASPTGNTGIVEFITASFELTK